jgi:hypothetical protein
MIRIVCLTLVLFYSTSVTIIDSLIKDLSGITTAKQIFEKIEKEAL